MDDLIDNSEINAILTILEEMSDQNKARDLLSTFNLKSKEVGQILLNKDPSLGSDEWEKLYKRAKEDLEKIISEINKDKKI